MAIDDKLPLTDQYHIQTSKDAFTGSINLGTWSYNDEYVEWLEKQLNNTNGIIKLFTKTIDRLTTVLDNTMDRLKEIESL